MVFLRRLIGMSGQYPMPGIVKRSPSCLGTTGYLGIAQQFDDSAHRPDHCPIAADAMQQKILELRRLLNRIKQGTAQVMYQFVAQSNPFGQVGFCPGKLPTNQPKVLLENEFTRSSQACTRLSALPTTLCSIASFFSMFPNSLSVWPANWCPIRHPPAANSGSNMASAAVRMRSPGMAGTSSKSRSPVTNQGD